MAVAPERRAMPLVGEPMVEWAVWYGTVMGWRVIPCRGKVAVIKNWRNTASSDEAQIRAWWAEFHAAGFVANIAVLMGHGLVTLDVDARYDGPATLERLVAEHAVLPATTTSITGSRGGSMHKLFTGGEQVRNKAPIGKGIDVQGEGSYIIVPPSIHPDTGYEYAWETGIDAEYGPDKILPQPLPAWLADMLTQPSNTNGHSNGVPIDPGVFVDHHRNIYLTSQAGKLRAAGFDGEEIYAALGVRNAQRCSPPLPAEEVKTISYGMERYTPEAELIVTTRTAPLGFPSGITPPTAANEQIPPSPTAWMKDLFIYAKSGELKQNAFNIGQILRNHPFWHMPERKLWYDVIRGYHMCGKEQISKSLCTRATQWFGGQMRLAISNIELLKLCMEAEAAENHIDLLEQHLLELHTWDRVKRLDTWLHEVTGAEDNEYTRYLSRALPVSMVARVLAPGCPCRLVVILEGKENIGKSHLVEAIATSEWYTILSMSLEGKDSHIMLHKYWIAELAELDSLSRTEEARMKAFVTMETDTYVPKYSNVAVSIPRRTIFMGTTNDASGYLKGQSGNTRYFPLKVGDRIDVDKFRLLRDKIFAEALTWYSEHTEDWWHEPAEVTVLANEARELRRQASDYEQPLHEWLEYTRFDPGHYEEGYDDTGKLVRKQVPFTRNETSWPEIARWFLKIDAPERWKDRSLQIQIASALKALGWVSSPVWRFGRTTRIWTLPEPGSEG